MFHRVVLTLLLLLNVSAGSAQGGKTVAVEKETLVKEVLGFAGSRRILAEIAAGYTDSFIQSLSKLDPAVRDNLEAAIAETFSAPLVTVSLEREFSKAMDYDSLVEVKRWHETPFGKRVLDVEASERFGENRSKKLQQFAAELSSNPTPSARMEGIAALEGKVKVADETLNALTKLMTTMNKSILTVGGQTEDEKKTMLSQLESSFRSGSGPQLRNDTFVSHQYVYRSFSDADIDQYVQFLGTPTGQKYARAAWSSLQVTLEAAAVEAGRRCADVLRKYIGR